jgi:hypothetical protein
MDFGTVVEQGMPQQQVVHTHYDCTEDKLDSSLAELKSVGGAEGDIVLRTDQLPVDLLYRTKLSKVTYEVDHTVSNIPGRRIHVGSHYGTTASWHGNSCYLRKECECWTVGEQSDRRTAYLNWYRPETAWAVNLVGNSAQLEGSNLDATW